MVTVLAVAVLVSALVIAVLAGVLWRTHRVRQRYFKGFKRERAWTSSSFTRFAPSYQDFVGPLPDDAPTKPGTETEIRKSDFEPDVTGHIGPVRQCDDPEAYYDDIVEHEGEWQTCSRCKSDLDPLAKPDHFHVHVKATGHEE